MSASALLLNATSYPDSSFLNTANVLAAKSIVALTDETTQQPQSLYLGATKDLSLQALEDLTFQLGSTRTLTVTDSNATETLLVKATDSSTEITSVAKDLKLQTSDNAAHDIVVGATTISQESNYQMLHTSMTQGFLLDNSLVVRGSELVEGSLSVGNNVVCQSNVFAQNYNLFRPRDSSISMNQASLAGFAWVVNDLDQLELLKYASFSNKRVTKRVAVFGQNSLYASHATDSNYLAFDEMGVSFVNGTSSNIIFNSSTTPSTATNPFLYNGTSLLALADSNVQITGHLLPASNVTYDLGSSTARFRDLYLSGQTINLGDTKLTVNATTSNLEVKDATNNLRKLVISELQLGDSTAGDVITLRKDPAVLGKLKFEKTASSGAKTDLLFAGSGVLELDASDFTKLRSNKTLSVVKSSQLLTTAGAQWATSVDTPNGALNDDVGNAVAVDLAGNVYLAGNYSTGTVGGAASTVVYNLNNMPSGIVLRAPDGAGNAVFAVKYNTAGIAQWAVSLDGLNGDQANGVAVDEDGNMYLTGNYNGNNPMFYNAGNVSSGVSLPNSVGNAAYLAKYSELGILQWVAYVEGAGSDVGKGVRVDSNGNVFMAAWYEASAVIHNAGGAASTTVTLRTPTASSAAVVIKFNSDGVAQWAASVDGTGAERGNAVTLDVSGNVYLACQYTVAAPTIYNAGNASSGLSLAAPGSSTNAQMVVVKYDASGVAQWATSAIGAGSIIANGIRTDTSGDMYVCGTYNGIGAIYDAGNTASGTVSFRSTNGNGNAAFLLKFNASGLAQWVTTADAPGSDYGNAVSVDTSGAVFLAGYGATPVNVYNSNGTLASLPARTTNTNTTAAFVLKFDAAGFAQWRIYLDGAGDDQGTAMAIDQWGVIYLAGKYANSAPVLYNTDNTASSVSLRSVTGTAAYVLKYAQSTVSPTYKVLSDPAKFVNGQQKFVLNTGATSAIVDIRDVADTTTLSTFSLSNGEVKKLMYYDGWVSL